MTAAARPTDVMAVASRWAVSSVAVQFAKSLLLLGSQVVLARLLGPADFGIVAMCAPIFGLCCLFNDLGLSQAVIQSPSLSVDDSNNIFWINFALGCVLALVLLLLAPALASFYNDHRVAEVLAALSLVIVVNSLSFQQVALMHRRMQTVPILLIDIAPVLANAIASISAAQLNFGYWAIVIGQMVHALTAGLLAWTLSPFRPARPHALAKALPLMRFGAHLTGLSIASFAATSLSPLLIGRLFGAQQVGLFDRGYKLVSMSSVQFLTPLSRIAETSLARLYADLNQYRQAHLQFSEALILFLTPGLVCLAFMSDYAVQVLYGSEWIAASDIVRWFSVAGLLAPAGTAASWLFVSQGRTDQMLRYGLVGQVLSVLSLVLGLLWGPVGVAVSAAIFSIPIHGLTLWGATRHGPVSLSHFLNMLFPIGLSIIVSAALLYGASYQVHRLALHPLIALTIGLLTAYSGAGLALCATRPGRRIIRNAQRAAQMIRPGTLSARQSSRHATV
ncbi:lipopolysaccharide biosynthesis protein [Bradyrhizobium sp. ARR65]|uniref:lipopolysaccharide biosynthesis protein n=1 Tax=Bradyrhizobium sp. ARR65 TaxID=1040989 RepID=UPI00055664F0|nr:lipopolysaccharide biosynthesis protein [Bradyrhizobium sp. ARR65]